MPLDARPERDDPTSDWRSLWDRTWLLPATGHDFAAADRLDLALDRVEEDLAAAGFDARDGWVLVAADRPGSDGATWTVAGCFVEGPSRLRRSA